MIERTCQQCGKQFFVYPSKLSGKNGCKSIFCSRECYAKARIQRIECICETCGKHFWVRPYRVKRGQGRFCSLKCFGASPKHISKSPLCGNYQRSETQKQAAAERARLLFRGKQCKPRSEEHKQKISQTKKGRPLLKSRRRVEQKCLTCGVTFTTHICRVKHGYGKFCSKSCFYKSLEGIEPVEATKRSMMGIKPTKPERKLQVILDKYFAGQYKYTGDGKLVINGMRPDFANCNGKKDVIEVFGNFWHGPNKTRDNWRATELGKMMAYGSLGYRCLVIWERELNNLPEEKIVKKITAFRRERSNADYSLPSRL